MSEVMISESIVEAEWILKGYWIKMRYAFQTDKGGWSDVDMLAYNPEKKHLVISESKVRGQKQDIFAYTSYTKERYGSIFDYDEDNYFSFLKHLPMLCKDGTIFNNFNKMVKKITIQLVSNYVVTSDVKEKVLKDINREIKTFKLPTQVEFKLDTTLDVITRVIEEQRESSRGRRYGHPLLDIAREINRYMDPKIHYAGRSSEALISVRDEAIKKFLETLTLESK